jgi:enoyl-CoA hydratase/carnithine racemase
MALIEIERKDGVAKVILNNGTTNAINMDLVTELYEKVIGLKDDPSVKALVLMSNNDKFFCIGFDLPFLFEQDRGGVMRFYQTVNRLCIELYAYPKPTVAAVKGHAIAGGCILTLCCDYRFIADGRKLMGLNEIKLGLPVPYPATCILQQIVGDRWAREIMESGDFYPAEASLKMGLVDEVLPIDQVLPRAMEKARSLGTMTVKACHMIKRNRVDGVKGRILARLEAREMFFLECFFSDEARALIREALKKF